MGRRIMPGRRAAAAVATALSLAAASAGGAIPAHAEPSAERPGAAGVTGALATDRQADAEPADAERIDSRRTDPATDPLPDARKKLSTALRARLETDRPTDFWIRLEDRADLSAASSITDWAERGEYVHDALTSTARRSQAGVVKKLRAAGVRYETFWISNAVLVVDGDRKLAERLATEPAVERVHERVAVERIDPVEQDPAGEAVPEAVEWGVEAVNAPAVWDLGHTGEGITVSTIDSGADVDHPALAPHYRGAQPGGGVSHDYNWFDAGGSCDGQPCDNYGHGTHVTGTMVGDDGAGNQIGVAPGAEWIAANGCDSCSDADLLASGEWILAPTRVDGSQPNPAMRPHVVNNSWGSPMEGDINDFFADEIAAWEAAGIFGVWAAGNAGEFGCRSASSPGGNTEAFSVGATTGTGEIAVFSSRGPGEDGLVKPIIAAPGQDVRSSVPGGGYEFYSGTSMAAPHVTGAVALLWSAVPSLIGDIPATWDLLNASAVDHPDDECGGTPENNNVYGEGDLDALALIQAAGAEERGHLAGTVTDTDGEPVDGATITVGDRSTATDPTGAYDLLLPAGTYDLTVEAFGFLPYEASGLEVSDDATTVHDVVLERAPTTTVRGTITDGSGHGWPLGAQISVEDAPPSFTAWSDPFTGQYALQVPTGATHRLTIDPDLDGYQTVRRSVAVGTDEVVRDVKVPVAPACTAPGYEFGGAGIGIERFESGEVPAGWSVQDFAGTGEVWTFDDAFGYGNMTGGEGLFAEVNSDGYGEDGHQDTALTTPRLDFSELSQPSVRFLQAFDVIGGEFADVELSIDGGQTWKPVLRQRQFHYGAKQVALTDAGGESNVRVRFHYGNAYWAFWWQIDDVAFGECLPVEGGFVAGHVTDLNTGEGVVGAEVSDAAAPDAAVETVEPENPRVGPGYYALFTPPGERQLTVAERGYVASEAAVDVVADAVTRHDATLAAPLLTVSPEQLSDAMVLGGTGNGTFTVTNEGTAPADLELYPGSSDFEILSDAAGGAVIKGVEGEATRIETASGGKADGERTDARRYRDSGRNGDAVTPAPTATLLAGEGTTITHSTSQEIVPGNSASCGGAATQVLRTFTLEDFGIGGDFGVTNVSFGVELAESAVDLTVNLYTLDGEMAYANLELIGSAGVSLEPQELTMVDVPVEGTAPAGSTLVVEVAAPDGPFFYIGSNAEPETAPTYIASEQCGNVDPVPTAEVGFPGMHVVMNVTGDTEVDVPWLDVQPPAFSLEPGESAQIEVAMDSGLVDQPGSYTAGVVVDGATPYTSPRAVVEMVVTPPNNWGKIAGTVTGQPCEGDPAPLEGAFVRIDGTEHDVTLVTDPDGRYARWMGVSNNRLKMLSSADGYPPVMVETRIIAGRTVVKNFALTEFCD